MIRRFLGFALLGLLLLASPGRAADPTSDSPLDAETMKAVLRTATMEEEGFIQRVLDLSKSGRLPAGMVEGTFQWARHKPSHKFQYFKQALIFRAQQAGVDLTQPDPPVTPTSNSAKHSILDWFRTQSDPPATSTSTTTPKHSILDWFRDWRS